MTATSVILADEEIDVSGVGYSPEGMLKKNGEGIRLADHPRLVKFLACVKTVNDAHLVKGKKGKWSISGGATEGCLLTLAESR